MDYFSTAIDLGEKGIVFNSVTILLHIQYFKDLLGDNIDYEYFLRKFRGDKYDPISFHLRFIEFLRMEGEVESLKKLFKEKKTKLCGYFRDDYKILKYTLTVELEGTDDLLSKHFKFFSSQKHNNTELSCIREDYIKLYIGG